MQIKRLTVDATPRIIPIGKLRKGGEKPANGVGKELDYWRYTSDTHPESVVAFNEIFGDKPKAIRVYLPFQSVDDNFMSAMEAYTASRLQHRCDGEYVVLQYDQKTKSYDQPEYGKVKCPGSCKEVGRLQVILPDLWLKGFPGIVTVETHSQFDIMRLYAQLNAWYSGKDAKGMLRGDLSGTEMILFRYPEMIPTPSHGRQKKYLVGLKLSHEYIQAQIHLMEQQKAAFLLNAGIELLGDGSIDADYTIDEDTGEIIDELPAVIQPDEVKLSARDDYEMHILPAEPTKPKTEAPKPTNGKSRINSKPKQFTDSQRGMFHALATQLYPTAALWEKFRPILVDYITEGRTKSSNEFSGEEMAKAIDSLTAKQEAIQDPAQLDKHLAKLLPHLGDNTNVEAWRTAVQNNLELVPLTMIKAMCTIKELDSDPDSDKNRQALVNAKQVYAQEIGAAVEQGELKF